MVVVPQEGFLFSGTIRDNLRIAKPDATDDEIARRPRRATASRDRIAAFTDGLDTEVQRARHELLRRRAAADLDRAAARWPTRR